MQTELRTFGNRGIELQIPKPVLQAVRLPENRIRADERISSCLIFSGDYFIWESTGTYGIRKI